MKNIALINSQYLVKNMASQVSERKASTTGKHDPCVYVKLILNFSVKEVKEMSDDQKSLMMAITKGDFDEVQTVVRTSNMKLNFADENGMSPLQNACYKGNLDICKFLIERGAEVNANEHVHGYTALMFAALGGHCDIVSLLLDSGASTTAVNSVGRTASAMAAFVGQHKVVAVINNFVSKEVIEAYTKGEGKGSKAVLPYYLVDAVHAMVRTINVHPVKLIFAIINNKGLLDHGSSVVAVLHSLRDREMQKEDPNEALSLKFHFLAFFIDEIMKFDAKTESTEASRFDPLIKTFIKGRDEDGFPLNLEIMLRSSIREFPFRDSVLFLQLVKTLSSVQVGSEPSAVSILFQSLNGQKGFDDDVPVCSTCCEPLPTKRCSACQTISYCDQTCQKLHWFTHKKFCNKLKHNYEQALSKKMSQVSTEKSTNRLNN